MHDEFSDSDAIPVLTDVVEDEPTPDTESDEPAFDGEILIAELQTKLSVSAFDLTEQLLLSAISEMESTLREQVLIRLRQELPELIDTVLREHFDVEIDDE
jgi:hypothetical protein